MNEWNAERSTGLEMTNVASSWPGASLYKSLKLGWQWRRLKWAVAAASEAAQGHEANGVRPGSQEFKTLYNEVAKKVQAYSHESRVPIDTLKAKLPALCAIERLANPEASVPQNRLGLTLGVVMAAFWARSGLAC